MSAPRDYADFLRDMLSEAQYAQQFVHGVTFEEFAANPEKQRAVVRCIEIVGEAARNIPASVREVYPQIDWREIAGMRDKLIHGYSGIGLTIVWDAAQNNLPVLESQLEQILAEMDSGE